MDFDWDERTQELYSGIRDFARDLPVAHVGPFSRETWRRLGEFGVLGLCVPEEQGGLGLNALSSARCLEALGRGCPDLGLAFAASAHLFAGVMPLVDAGSDSLQDRWLEPAISGELIVANAITEAEAGSDVFALRTLARPDGDHYVLNGAKSYVTNGPLADLFVVYATANPAHRFMGVTAFAVPRDTPGVVVGKPFETMGLTSAPISSVYFEDCRVPRSSVIGAVGRGASVFTESMAWERACLFAAYLGAMERQLEVTVDYAKQRRQFDKPIGKHQAVAHRLVGMKQRLEASRWLLYRACWERDQGRAAVLDIALAKLAISEGAVQSSLDAIQVHGGIGYATESGIEVGLRDAVGSTIFSGTSEIQRNLAARELGL